MGTDNAPDKASDAETTGDENTPPLAPRAAAFDRLQRAATELKVRPEITLDNVAEVFSSFVQQLNQTRAQNEKLRELLKTLL